MSQIWVENLTKTFRVAERRAGLAGAFSGLLKRRYRDVNALDGVDFRIEAGELVGYIGPNGAGKSTTIKILSGILVPTSGRCEVNGFVPWRATVSNMFVALAWCLDSAPNCGGTYRLLNRLSCFAISTACPSRLSGKAATA